jgi:hypothetical protein
MIEPKDDDIQTVSSILGILPTDLEFFGGDYNDHYYRVVYQGRPIGAFWWQHRAKHWQGMNNDNHLLKPNKDCSRVLTSIVDHMEA